MCAMFHQLDDTIVAVSSPAGTGVRGILRLSGPGAFGLAAGVFTCNDGRSVAELAGHRRVAGRLWMEATASVPAEAYTFRAPASYTRQDVIELHTIGSPAVLGAVLERLTSAGARPAEPGEFTARAFFSGAMDLTRVEGVAGIIHARNDSQLRASEALLHGRLSRRSNELREQLIDLLALIEAEIDFSEEAVEFVAPQRVAEVVSRVYEELALLIHQAPSIERLETLPEVMLVGRPNAGKSTLMNVLTGMDRAIQSAMPGTTRDVLSVPLNVPGGEVMLLDAAGLEAGIGESADEEDRHPDAQAQATARRLMLRAAMLIPVVDATDSPRETLELLRRILPPRPMCVALSKADLVGEIESDRLAAELQGAAPVRVVSAVTGLGLDLLREEIGRTLFAAGESSEADVVMLSDRQRQALRIAHEALGRARHLCEENREVMNAAELLAVEIREAINGLSVLVGEVATEELLGRIFSRFCIGK
ncbi:MAG TPA: tRNA modification GTPase [Phycisphaerae bacterium]|nr:tRNA modification GTPase [Phycisphaerae bacterium]HRR87076.1 tRNA modification GTPase [Phycisphaerae bacterium]